MFTAFHTDYSLLKTIAYSKDLLMHWSNNLRNMHFSRNILTFDCQSKKKKYGTYYQRPALQTILSDKLRVFIKLCQHKIISALNLNGHQNKFGAVKQLAPNYALADSISPVFFDMHSRLISVRHFR
jgi:hypothetical protein